MNKRTELHTNDNADKAVSPVIAIILMVAITVVLAGVLYVWVTQFGPGVTGDITISGNFKDLKTGANQEFPFQFSAPSNEIKYDDMKIVLENASVQEVNVKVADLMNTGTIDQGIYVVPTASVANGNITLYDNNGNRKLDSGDKLFVDPDVGQDWTGWKLIIQVSGKPAMDKTLPSS